LKIRVRVRVILGKVRGEEGKGKARRVRPNTLNIVASRNYLATFNIQQLATLGRTKNSTSLFIMCRRNISGSNKSPENICFTGIRLQLCDSCHYYYY